MSPCGGCGSRPLNEAMAARMPQVPKTDRPPLEALMVVVAARTEGPIQIIGRQSGKNYGWHERGDIFRMAIVDADVDDRVLVATQEILRKVSSW